MAVFIGATNKSDLTQNQYYKGLNNRFDNRVKKLMRAKYSYSVEYRGWYRGSNPKNERNTGRMIDNASVMYAENRAFNDMFHRRFNLGK
jgi:hypothetical protein